MNASNFRHNSLRVAMISIHSCPLAILGGPDSGGMNVYIRELSRQLGALGIAVDVFTRMKYPSLPKIVHMGPSARVIHLPAGEIGPYEKHKIWDHLDEFTSGIMDFAREEGIDYGLVHGHYWLSGSVAGQLKDTWQIPMAQMFHTLGELKNRAFKDEEHRETELRIQVEQEVMAQADLIIASTPLEKAHMTWFYKAYPAKIKIVPCGVDSSLFKPIPPPVAKSLLGIKKEKIILFVGRLDPIKGIDFLFEAMTFLVNKMQFSRDDLALYILGGVNNQFGTGTDAGYLKVKEKINSMHLEDIVILQGAQLQEILPYYYSSADVCVLPSFYESFGLVSLEAMACGTPMIASRVGGLPFVIEDGKTGFLVPAGNSTILAEKIAQLLSNPSLRSAFAMKAVEMAGSYDWEHVAHRVACLYDGLLADTLSYGIQK
ncbi:MAG: glycosyltransferase [Candidatus Tectomicrobia bacterium]|uniref:Glycosyltransferase n=1 Tax=Tectimicrobiota bacterium TaxID=2528274 RepID=A0A933LQU7_UNCTE|nr:glycosyltransferase [Candidatus Tectomicrobia bacterium]